jgi:hypothetical protein
MEQRTLAFVGQEIYFAPCALDPGVAGFDTTFIDFRAGDDPEKILVALDAAAPDVAFFFKPEVVPAALLQRRSFVSVGWATEPLPSLSPDEHLDLNSRRSALSRLDPANFDRLIAYTPGIVASLEEIMTVWRCVPLPVGDRYYRTPRRIYGRPRVIFIGRSTDHRESLLIDAKHRYDLTHIAHGVGPVELERIADSYHVGINLHNEAYPNFENRVTIHMAAGHLVLSEPLTPTMGLEPGIDFLQVQSSVEMMRRLAELMQSPDIYHRVRVRGREKAELFRASRVYPALVADLERDVAVFGAERPLARPH